MILGISRARQVTDADEPKLLNVVRELSLAANLPEPKVYVIEDTALNAFATGRDPEHASVAVTRGLLQRLDREELQGVVGPRAGPRGQLRHPLQPAGGRARRLHRADGRRPGAHDHLGQHDRWSPQQQPQRWGWRRCPGADLLRGSDRGDPGAALRAPGADGGQPPARIPRGRHQRRAHAQPLRAGASAGQAGHRHREARRCQPGDAAPLLRQPRQEAGHERARACSAPTRPSSTASTACASSPASRTSTRARSATIAGLR